MAAEGGPAARLLALGDSITVGVDDSPSWARLLAEARGWDVEVLARNGLTAPALVRELLPMVVGRYEIAALFIGVNEVRSPDWREQPFESALARIFARMRQAAGRLVVATAPLDLGRPPAGPKVADLNAIVIAHARRVGAAVARLDDLEGPAFFQADAVHPTAAGQAEIARRFGAALG